jgi:hypothetical protein
MKIYTGMGKSRFTVVRMEKRHAGYDYYNSFINPLTQELNPSEQACLPEFFPGGFEFYCILLEKKLYLIDFSFKFNEIKFCTLLVNWLIRGKNVTPIFIINLGL